VVVAEGVTEPSNSAIHGTGGRTRLSLGMQIPTVIKYSIHSSAE
jgi:hypothetical protein